MSKITRQKRTDNFTVVNNDVIQNKNLSWAAKGMLVYLLHLPDNWQINVADLSNRSKNGRDGTAGIIKELMSAGYISRTKIKNEKAQFKGYDYTVTDKPVNGKAVNGLSVDGSSVNGKAVTSKDYQEEELSVLRTNDSIEETQNEIEESKEQNDILAIVHDQVDETAVKVVEVIPSKAKKGKYIYPPTQEELVPLFYAKFQEKKRDHQNIVDCWNWANHQSEKFFLHWEGKGWKIEKLNGAIATWVNGAMGYGTLTKPCPIQYKNNPLNTPQPEQLKAVQTQITKQDLDARKAMFAAAKAELNQIGV